MRPLSRGISPARTFPLAHLAALAGLCPLASHAGAQAIPFGDLAFDLVPVAQGFVAPDQVTHAGDHSGRLFVVDQVGKVWIVKDGQVLPQPFLQIQPPELVNVNLGYDERGLLGLAFHPDFAHNGRVFVRYSHPRPGSQGEPCFGTGRGCHEEILAEYHVSASNPDQIDPASARVLLRISKPQFNHNSGTVAFGPDGYLYMGMGDGGGANDGLADNPPSHGPFGNGQNIHVLLGKILRLDVDHGDPYAIPGDNPFASGDGADEVFAYGMRNPFNFSFDDGPGGSGELWLGEVGQNLFEEVDIVHNGGNYGWVLKEGFHCFDPFNPNVPPPTCDSTGLIDPVVEYDHVNGGIAVVGGAVYRGADFPGLRGIYLFGDFSTTFNGPDGHLFYIDTTQPQHQMLRPLVKGSTAPLGLFVKGTGRDEEGNIYFTVAQTLGPSGTTGVVLRITRCAADFNGDGRINQADYDGFIESFVDGGDAADADHSGFVDTDDFTEFVHQFESGCSQTAG